MIQCTTTQPNIVNCNANKDLYQKILSAYHVLHLARFEKCLHNAQPAWTAIICLKICNVSNECHHVLHEQWHPITAHHAQMIKSL